MKAKRASGWSVWQKALVISTTLIPVVASADAGGIPAAKGLTDSKSSGTYASPERQDAAVGHYARARSLLVEALAEFEQARSVARPDLLLDPEDWRLTIISKTEELNRLLDPQPRVTRSGVRFKASPELIRTDRSARASMGGGPQDSNYAGEAQIEKELGMYSKSRQAADAPEADPAAQKAIPSAVSTGGTKSAATTIEVPKLDSAHDAASDAAKAKVLVSPKEAKEMNETISKIDELKKPVDAPTATTKEEGEAAIEASKLRDKLRAAQQEEQSAVEPDKGDSGSETAPAKGDADKVTKKINAADKENLEMSKAIEDAIRARLKKVSSMAEPPADAPAVEDKTSEAK